MLKVSCDVYLLVYIRILDNVQVNCVHLSIAIECTCRYAWTLQSCCTAIRVFRDDKFLPDFAHLAEAMGIISISSVLLCLTI